MICPPWKDDDLSPNDLRALAIIEKAVGERVIPLTESRFEELQALVEGVPVDSCDITPAKIENER